MDTVTIKLKSAGETEKFGLALGAQALPGDVLCLDGDLGAGKTTLSQAIARGVEVEASCYVTSPSFAIMHEYPAKIPMYHMDFYRLGDSDEVLDLGFDEYFYLSGLTVIEWSSRAADIIPDTALMLEIEISSENSRLITLRYDVDVWRERIVQILAAAGFEQVE